MSTKSVLIGSRRFEISGISDSDPYFAAIHDNFEPEFVQLCTEFIREDYVCVDIGANIGLKTLSMAQHAPNGRVIAFDASPTVAAVLEQNIDRSGMNNVTVVHAAIGDTDGTVRFLDNSAWGHISPSGVEVPIQRLEYVVETHGLNRLDFIKIDVEGFEPSILKSSLDIIHKYRSMVLFEFNSFTLAAFSNTNLKEFIEWILNNFSNVYVVRRNPTDGHLDRLLPGQSVAFLHYNMVDDRLVSDLLVTNFEDRLCLPPNVLASKLSSLIEQKNTAIAERDDAVAERNTSVSERDAAVAERNTSVSERDAAVAERNTSVAERDAAVAERNTSVAERDAAVAEMNEAISQRDLFSASATRWFEAAIAITDKHNPLTKGGSADPWYKSIRQRSKFTMALADYACGVHKWELAVRYYRDALDIEPKNPEIWARLGDALNKAGKTSEAELALEVSQKFR